MKKYYFDYKMMGFPTFINHAGLVEALKKILIEGFGVKKSSVANSNHLIFNDGYYVNEYSIYKIDDDVNSIESKVKQIDINTVFIIEDIGSLNKNNISISAAPVGDWSYEKVGSEDVFKSIDTEVTINSSEKKWKISGNIPTDYINLSSDISSLYSAIIADKFGTIIMSFSSRGAAYKSYNFLLNKNGIKAISNASGSTVSTPYSVSFNTVVENASVSYGEKLEYVGGSASNESGPNAVRFSNFGDATSNVSFSDVFIHQSASGLLQSIGTIDESLWSKDNVFIDTEQGVICILTTFSSGNKNSGVPVLLESE